MLEKPSKVVPALVGGVVLGILSSIPFVNWGNCCFCLWVLVGGAIAAKMLITRSPVYPVQSGDGAIAGLLAGVVGSLVYFIIGIPLALLLSQAGSSTMIFEWLRNATQDPNAREQIDQFLRMQQQRGSLGQSIISALITWAVCSVVAIGFAALGGLIGVQLFEKRKGGPPQGYPPPSGYPPPPSGYPPPPPGYPPSGPGAPYGGGGNP
jgi:hypothetical protein